AAPLDPHFMHRIVASVARGVIEHRSGGFAARSPSPSAALPSIGLATGRTGREAVKRWRFVMPPFRAVRTKRFQLKVIGVFDRIRRATISGPSFCAPYWQKLEPTMQARRLCSRSAGKVAKTSEWRRAGAADDHQARRRGRKRTLSCPYFGLFVRIEVKRK